MARHCGLIHAVNHFNRFQLVLPLKCEWEYLGELHHVLMEKMFSGFHSDDIQQLCLNSGDLTLFVADVTSIYW